MSSKSPAIPMATWLQTVWDWRLPKRYHLSMCLKGLQSFRLSNFFHFSKIVLFILCIIFSYENRATYEHFWCFEILKLQRKFHFKIHLSRWNSTNEISLCNVNSTYSFRFYLGVPFQSLAWWDFEFGDTILLTSKFLYNVVFSKGSILLRKSA